MTKHDQIVLEVARSELKRGAKWIAVGNRVVSRKKIVARLQKAFPDREIVIEGNCDYMH